MGAEPEEEIVQGGMQLRCKGGESITHYNTTRKVVVR